MYRKISIFLFIIVILVSLSGCTNKIQNIETVQDLNSAETNNSIEESNEKTAMIDKEEVINVYETSTFILYVDYTDKAIHFIDYTGEAKREPIPIYFFELTHDKTTNPAFSFKLSEYGYMLLKVYKGRELKYDAEEYSISTKIWN